MFRLHWMMHFSNRLILLIGMGSMWCTLLMLFFFAWCPYFLCTLACLSCGPFCIISFYIYIYYLLSAFFKKNISYSNTCLVDRIPYFDGLKYTWQCSPRSSTKLVAYITYWVTTVHQLACSNKVLFWSNIWCRTTLGWLPTLKGRWARVLFLGCKERNKESILW